MNRPIVVLSLALIFSPGCKALNTFGERSAVADAEQGVTVSKQNYEAALKAQGQLADMLAKGLDVKADKAKADEALALAQDQLKAAKAKQDEVDAYAKKMAAYRGVAIVEGAESTIKSVLPFVPYGELLAPIVSVVGLLVVQLMGGKPKDDKLVTSQP
jgi:hypothetical protein